MPGCVGRHGMVCEYLMLGEVLGGRSPFVKERDLVSDIDERKQTEQASQMTLAGREGLKSFGSCCFVRRWAMTMLCVS